MEQFDKLMKEMAEKEEMIVPKGFDERVQEVLDDLPSKTKKRRPRAVKAALIAAAACLFLMGTAFAAGKISTSDLVFDELGWVVLGQFEKGILVDEHKNQVDPSQLDDADLESGKYSVVHPESVNGMLLTEEDGRVILYGRNNLIDVRLDITDELLENGAFDYFETRETNYWLSLTVYSVDLEEYPDYEEHLQYDPDCKWYPFIYDGAAYLVDGSGMAPNDHGGEETFMFREMRSFSANSICLYDLNEFDVNE